MSPTSGASVRETGVVLVRRGSGVVASASVVVVDVVVVVGS